METLLRAFAEKGDIAHLALLLWALGASALAWRSLAEAARAAARFDAFVRELARFNARHPRRPPRR